MLSVCSALPCRISLDILYFEVRFEAQLSTANAGRLLTEPKLAWDHYDKCKLIIINYPFLLMRTGNFRYGNVSHPSHMTSSSKDDINILTVQKLMVMNFTLGNGTLAGRIIHLALIEYFNLTSLLKINHVPILNPFSCVRRKFFGYLKMICYKCLHCWIDIVQNEVVPSIGFKPAIRWRFPSLTFHHSFPPLHFNLKNCVNSALEQI